MTNKCTHCGATVPEGAKFCPECGEPLKVVCKKCGAENPPNARFCKECGSALSKKAAPKVKPEAAPAPKSEKSTTPFYNNPYFLIMLFALLAMVVATVYNFNLLHKPFEMGNVQNAPASTTTAAQPPNEHAGMSPEEVEQHIQEVSARLQENPDDPDLNIHMGNLLFDIERYSEAIPYYKKALERQPNNADVIVDLGICYFNLEDFEKAKELFNQALDINPNHLNALYNMGIVALQTGEMQLLMESWTKLSELAPNSPQAQNAAHILEQIHQSAQGGMGQPSN